MRKRGYRSFEGWRRIPTTAIAAVRTDAYTLASCEVPSTCVSERGHPVAYAVAEDNWRWAAPTPPVSAQTGADGDGLSGSNGYVAFTFFGTSGNFFASGFKFVSASEAATLLQSNTAGPIQPAAVRWMVSGGGGGGSTGDRFPAPVFRTLVM